MLSIYDDEHEMFRSSFRAFVAERMRPHYDQWDAAGIMPREVFTDAGSFGFLGFAIPEEYGGGGTRDFRFNCVIAEELAEAGPSGGALGLTLQTDIAIPYFLNYCNSDQASRWLPGIASGELITAIAMTEPGTGSDLAAIMTTATRDGENYRISGSKTFITNGINSDLVIVVCRTSPEAGRSGMSLIVVERGTPGFERGRNLDKVGQHSADTSELFFDDALVPAANLLGQSGSAFQYLGANLPQERMSMAVMGLSVSEVVLRSTVDYVKERRAFGQRIADFQNTRFVLAELATAIEVTRPFIEASVTDLNAGRLTATTAAMAKLHTTELQNRVVDQCLQLYGGYGYTTEYAISRFWTDARVATIYGGTSEIMKTIIAKHVVGS